MSLSPDNERDVEPGLATPAPAAGRLEEPVGGGGVADIEGGSLAHDVDEVERGRPERAFNVGATLGIVVTVAAVIFVLQNRQSTTFDWLWLDVELPLWTALLGAVGVGVVVVLTILAVHARRRRRVRRRRDAAVGCAGRWPGVVGRPPRDPDAERRATVCHRRAWPTIGTRWGACRSPCVLPRAQPASAMSPWVWT